METFRSGALEALFLCVLAFLFFCSLLFLGKGLTALLRSCFPRTPATEADDLGGLDLAGQAGRLTDILPTKQAAFPNDDAQEWLVEGFVDDWETAWAHRDWRSMGHALKLADQILFKLWRDEFEKSADVRPPIRGA